MIRAFIAVEVPFFQGIKDFSDELKRSPARIKLVEPENMHITLRFLGDIEEEIAERLGAEMQALSSEDAFSFELLSAGAFPNLSNPKVVWVGIEDAEALKGLQAKVEDICESLGLGRDKRQFSPHLTVGRVRERRPKGIRPVIERYRGHSFGTVEVKDVKLKKSVLTPQGPIYSDISAVRLRV